MFIMLPLARYYFFFFFQAEDGIRDVAVTGVQTCALPIFRRVGEPPKLGGSNKPKQHFEIGEALGLMDFETAAKLSGARFVVLKGQLARLERPLGPVILRLHTPPGTDRPGGARGRMAPERVSR